MTECRKAFHFDLDNERLREVYPSESKTGWKAAWGKITAFMEEHGFTHVQYSGYESVSALSKEKVFGILDELNAIFPWFHQCVQAASINDIGETHDVVGFLESINCVGKEPQPNRKEQRMSLAQEAKDMREAATALDSKRDHAELERNGDAR